MLTSTNKNFVSTLFSLLFADMLGRQRQGLETLCVWAGFSCDEMVAACFASDDYKEGRQAFMEKRKPNFVGK